MHFLDKNSGELVARVKVAKQRVSSQPVAVGDTVVVMTDGGSLAAFRAQPKTAAPAASAAPATEAAPTPSPQ
jgi:hypothetical protein